VDTDILKPDTGSVPFERISAPHSRLASTEASSGHLTPETRNSGPHYTEPVSEGEEDEEMDLAPAKDERKRTGISGQELDEAIAFREKKLKESQSSPVFHDGEEGPNERTPFLKNRAASVTSNVKPRALSIDPLAPSHAFDRTLRERLGNELEAGASGAAKDSRRTDNDEHEDEDAEVAAALRSNERILSRDFRAPKGKRIAVPVRIEPKVYFASERTFLVCSPPLYAPDSTDSHLIIPQKWLHFSIYIGTIATALLNFIEPGDTNGLISTAMFTFAALLAIAYSAAVFIYRSLRLRTRSAEGWYYDKYGPTALSLALVAALLTNVILRLSEL